MSNLKYVLGSYTLIPTVDGVSRDEEPVRETLTMVAGNERHYQRPVLRRVTWTLTDPGADEATWATWRDAARAAETGLTLMEPDGSTYTVVTASFGDPIIATTITSGAGTTSAVGTVERSLTLTLRSL